MKLLHYDQRNKNVLYSSEDDWDNAGIAAYGTQRIHKRGVTYGL